MLETVARIPYFAYISILHLYESVGFWRAGAELRKIHFAEVGGCWCLSAGWVAGCCAGGEGDWAFLAPAVLVAPSRAYRLWHLSLRGSFFSSRAYCLRLIIQGRVALPSRASGLGFMSPFI